MDLKTFRELDTSIEEKPGYLDIVLFYREMFKARRKFLESKQCIHVSMYLNLDSYHGRRLTKWSVECLEYDAYIFKSFSDTIPLYLDDVSGDQWIMFFKRGCTSDQRNDSLDSADKIDWSEFVWLYVDMFEISRRFYASSNCIHVGMYVRMNRKQGKMFCEWVTSHLGYDTYYYDHGYLRPLEIEINVFI